MVADNNPILVRRNRGNGLESIHRGCWAVVDVDGHVLASAGDPEQPIFPRSASKSLQGLGALDAGVERFALGQEQLAVMISSHNGELIHETAAGSLLTACGLDESALHCGEATPFDDPKAEPRRIIHNCSGKHAGFLAGAVALDQDPETYLDPEGAVQRRVQAAVVEMAAMGPDDWGLAVDGCSAPTFVMPLQALARGIARVATPDDLPSERARHCRLLTDAAFAHPELVAGVSPPRFDTELMAASKGRLFAKGGADGMQVIGVMGAGIAFAGKVDDGNPRGLLPVAMEVLDRLGHVSDSVREGVREWTDPIIRNAAGLEVGEHRLEPFEV